MKNGLTTPLGEIELFIDGEKTAFEAVKHVCTVRSVLAKPPAGNWCITVPAEGCRTIRCTVRLTTPDVTQSGWGGERYLCAEFVKEHTILTIGAEEENPALQTERIPGGMQYTLRAPVQTVRFGIAWATDYEGEYDIRTYLAADLF